MRGKGLFPNRAGSAGREGLRPRLSLWNLPGLSLNPQG